MTEIEAVNHILGYCGESPVNTLEDVLPLEAELVLQDLRSTNRVFQTQGYSFNTRKRVVLEAVEDCKAFLETAGDLIDASGLTYEQAGHDFWLTRNGHGAGFWDRGLGKVGDRLTALCKPFGTVDLYVGDDGQIHC